MPSSTVAASPTRSMSASSSSSPTSPPRSIAWLSATTMRTREGRGFAACLAARVRGLVCCGRLRAMACPPAGRMSPKVPAGDGTKVPRPSLHGSHSGRGVLPTMLIASREGGTTMKILIALDASPHSERALEFVSRMRWPAGSRVIVLSVVQPVASTVSGPYEAGGVPVEDLEAIRKRLEGLVAHAERTLREVGFATEARVLTGDPRQSLLDVARRGRAELSE